MSRPPLIQVVLASSVIALAVLVAASTASQSPSPGLVFDPSRAPIVFIPGVLASELGCGPAGSETEVWPGRSDDPAAWAAELSASGRFGDLAMVNVVNASGEVESHTTSSADCGSTAFEGGTIARHELDAQRPLWCLPELTADPLPQACSSGHEDVYSDFAVALQDRIDSDGRGQTFVSFAWDWRRSPADQVSELNALLEQVTQDTGVKATVVAHSFGNLMFREWVRAQGDGAGDRVGRFLGVAAPWWGVANAWRAPAFGQIQPQLLSLIAGLENVQTTFQSAPGIYWLFPTPSFADHVGASNGGSWLATASGGDPLQSEWVPAGGLGAFIAQEFTRCPQATTFPCVAGQLYETAAALFPAPGFDTSGIAEWTGIVGAGASTPSQVCDGCLAWPDGMTDGDAPTVRDPALVHRIRRTNGDGRVPVFSAIQGTDSFDPPGDDVPFYFTCGVTHVELMQTPDVLDRTIPYLTGDAPLTYDDVLTELPCEPTPMTATPSFTG